jgi:hypothetical protein
MERTVSIPDGTASHVNRFAAENDISIDRAHELLLTIGIETLDGVDLEVSVEDDRLILECPACGALFDAADEAVKHGCSNP